MSGLQRIREGTIHAGLVLCALVSVATTLGIVWVLLTESLPFFREVSPAQFLFGTVWEPFTNNRFGVLPLLLGTCLVALGALIVAIPIGLCTAIFLSEYAPQSVRQTLKPILEVLAGVPTVVYGFFALVFITDVVLKPLFGAETFNGASAAIVVGIMIIPTIASICDDAFQAVPQALREGAYALAATRFEVSTRVVLPSALSGVVAAVLLGLARAIGETMAVAIAAGMRPSLTVNPLVSIQTMTGAIVQIVSGDTPSETLGYRTIFVIALALFLMTLAVNLIAHRVLRRFREVYE